MTIKLANITARIINKRFSKSALAIAALELGVPLPAGGDIFQAIIDAGKASNFVDAVRLVAAHLDEGSPDANGE